MKVVWSRRARRDLKDIGRYIARDDPDAARRWVARLMARAAAAADCPLAGRVVAGFQNHGASTAARR